LGQRSGEGARLCKTIGAEKWGRALTEITRFILRTPSRAPYRTPSACAKRATYSDPPPDVVPDPESITAQADYPYRQSAIAQVVSGPNCFQVTVEREREREPARERERA
jgi:hypothetical protein